MLFRSIYLFIMFGVFPNRLLLDPPPEIRQDVERVKVVRGEEAQITAQPFCCRRRHFASILSSSLSPFISLFFERFASLN